MSERDLDIDFDFFEEGETAETAEAQRVPRRGGGGSPPGPPRQGTSVLPLLRLIGFVAFAIFIVVVMVFWIQSCQGASKQKKYSAYMQKVAALGTQSRKLGGNLTVQLTTPGIKLADLEEKINGLARQQQQLVEQAQAIAPPGPLRAVHQHMVESLQFRESGLAGLSAAFRREGSSSRIAAGAGKRIASQTDRFVASDVIWDDLFRTPAQRVLREKGVGDVRVPTSTFVQNPALTTSSTLVAILQRIRGASTGQTPSGRHGSGIVGVTVQPGGTPLSTSSETRVNASDKLAFQVTVKDTGDFVETRVAVHFVIQQSNPIRETKTIPLIEPNKTVTLTFSNNYGAKVNYGELAKIKVTVEPVPGETFTSNNSASYPVIFSLP